MTDQERIAEWNRTAADYPLTDCVHQQIERQASQTPDAVAVVFDNEALTYRELDERANRLAHYLAGRGVGPDTLVGVSIVRSLDLMVALLAIMKAGGAYVPLDPAFPLPRLALMVEDARPLLVLTEQRFSDRFPANTNLLFVDSEAGAIAQQSPLAPDSRATSGNLVYVIYTSGSTGKPKGVMIEHRNVVSFFTAMDRAIGDGSPGVWLAVTSISFDISVLELFWTLARGFRVVLQGDERNIAKNILEYQVTHLQCTPSLARMLTIDRGSFSALSRLRKLLLGGEALTLPLVEQIRQVFSGEMYNMYGPTETTVWSTTQRMEKGAQVVSIGKPIANTQTYILDAELRPATIGDTGELYIAGAGVVRGYLNNPTLTAERFLPNPFGTDPAGRMYKTGDLARYLPDGNIEYLGRADFQVKIRGVRIELGEIETVIERHPAVRQAVVIAREGDAGVARLVACMCLNEDTPSATDEIRAYLRENLPDSMQPSEFVVLAEMPLTANGKTDRNALLQRQKRDMAVQMPDQLPKNDLEQKIAAVWQEMLETENVGVEKNFFDLGAHSLMVAEVQNKLQDVLDREIPLVAMFRYPTIRALAAHLANGTAETPAVDEAAARAQSRRESMQRRNARPPQKPGI